MYYQIRITRQARATKSDKTKRSIYLRVFPSWQAGKDFIISTKITLDSSKWCDTKKQAKGTSIESQRVNMQLNKLEETCHKLFDEYIKSIETPKLNDYKAFVEYKIFNKGNGSVKQTLKVNELFDRYVRLHDSKLGSKRKSRYQFVGGKVNQFNTLKYGKSDVELEVLSAEWWKEFGQFLLKGFKYKQSTFNGYLKVLHAVVKDAYNSDYLKSYPFKGLKLDRIKSDVRYLSEDEYFKILRFNTEDERLMRAKDCFIFACNTGLSYTDMATAKRQNITRESDGNYTLTKNRAKTDVESIIPLNDFAIYIIQKYRNHPLLSGTDLLIPTINLNDYNHLLKLIAVHCGIDKNISSHIARHTFATNYITDGGTQESLKMMLGHSKITTTEKYGQIIADKVKKEARAVFQNQSRKGALIPDKYMFNDLFDDK